MFHHERLEEDAAMTQESDHAERMRGLFPGQLAPDEECLLEVIRTVFNGVLEGRSSFSAVVQDVSELLVDGIRNRLNLEAFRNVDASRLVEKVNASARLDPASGKQLTRAEEEFSRDVLCAMDFALRNGLSFAFIAHMVAHDLREIRQFGSIDEALRRGVLPKCRRYRELSELPIGETVQD
jgi:hypothetical protein